MISLREKTYMSSKKSQINVSAGVRSLLKNSEKTVVWKYHDPAFAFGLRRASSVKRRYMLEHPCISHAERYGVVPVPDGNIGTGRGTISRKGPPLAEILRDYTRRP